VARAQILWLKTLINLLYSFGRAAQPGDALYNWHVWMAILLTTSVCAMITINPYVSVIDQTVEVFAVRLAAPRRHCTVRIVLRMYLRAVQFEHVAVYGCKVQLTLCSGGLHSTIRTAPHSATSHGYSWQWWLQRCCHDRAISVQRRGLITEAFQHSYQD
jgi:hypothetical protein